MINSIQFSSEEQIYLKKNKYTISGTEAQSQDLQFIIEKIGDTRFQLVQYIDDDYYEAGIFSTLKEILHV